ncbi:MAG: DNA-3-methyladenine glycosylase, partial [Pseudomonadota bacterium]
QTMLDFLAARAIPGVELVTEGAYVRTVRIGEHRGWLRVRPVGGKAKGVRHALNLSISENLQPVATTVIGRIKALFDTRADAAEITDHLGRDPVLATIVKKVPGMRLPGAFDGFELLLRAIIGQQISVAGATTVAGRAAQRFGEVIQTPWPELNRTNPTADRLARARVGSIAQLGMPGKRASSIKLAATRVASEELRLVPGADPEIVRALLTSIPGIGDWTAAYVAMRGLGWPDALPAADLGIKKALGLTKVKDVEARTETWRPWRAYGAIYCWLSLSGG